MENNTHDDQNSSQPLPPNIPQQPHIDIAPISGPEPQEFINESSDQIYSKIEPVHAIPPNKKRFNFIPIVILSAAALFMARMAIIQYVYVLSSYFFPVVILITINLILVVILFKNRLKFLFNKSLLLPMTYLLMWWFYIGRFQNGALGGWAVQYDAFVIGPILFIVAIATSFLFKNNYEEKISSILGKFGRALLPLLYVSLFIYGSVFAGDNGDGDYKFSTVATHFLGESGKQLTTLSTPLTYLNMALILVIAASIIIYYTNKPKLIAVTEESIKVATSPAKQIFIKTYLRQIITVVVILLVNSASIFGYFAYINSIETAARVESEQRDKAFDEQMKALDDSREGRTTTIASVLSGKTIKSITVGSFHTCAIASDNLAYCWGDNSDYQLGNGSTAETPYAYPIAIDTSGVLMGKSIKSISAGDSHTCVIASDDLVYCWGRNDYGQLGNKSVSGKSSVPVLSDGNGLISGMKVLSLSSGETNTCVITTDKTGYCWGDNQYRQSGTGKINVAGKLLSSISSGGAHTCAITVDNSTYCWGYNFSGSLGNGVDVSSNSDPNSVSVTPSAVYMAGVLNGKTIKTITAGGSVCAIASDNLPYCWGGNQNGELGVKQRISNVPVAMELTGTLAGKTVLNISNGSSNTCAVFSDNNAYCWGWGGLLNSNLTKDMTTDTWGNVYAAVPVDSSGKIGGVKSITVSNRHGCLITTNGKAYCWGDNQYGKLGTNSITVGEDPAAVYGM